MYCVVVFFFHLKLAKDKTFNALLNSLSVSWIINIWKFYEKQVDDRPISNMEEKDLKERLDEYVQSLLLFLVFVGV